MINKTFKADSSAPKSFSYLQASLNLTDAIPSATEVPFKLMLYFNKENNYNYLDLPNPNDYPYYHLFNPNVVIGDVVLYTLPSINNVDTSKNISITQIVGGLTNAPSNNIPLLDGPIPMEFWTGPTGDTPGILVNTTDVVELDYKSQVVELGREPYGFPNRRWNSIESNLSGERLIASAYDDRLYVSRDYGISWAPTQSVRPWTSVAMNDTGNVLAATTNGGQIYISSDYGESWNVHENNRFWSDIDLNSSGTAVVAVVNNGFIYRSTNIGITWTPVLSDFPRAWSAIASNSSGTHLIATVNGGYIYYSVNSGTTWNLAAFDSFRAWTDVINTASGTIAYAVVNNGYIYKSTDSGATWTAVLSDASRAWTSVTTDDTGTIVYATLSNHNGIFVSTNAGATWTERISDSTLNWSAITTNGNGSFVAATVFDGQIYSSTDYGMIWDETTNTYKYLGLYIEGLTPTSVERNRAVVHILIKIYNNQ